MGDSPELSIRLDRSAYLPAETVRAAVAFEPRQSVTVRGGTLRLLCVGDYSGASSKYHSGKARVVHFEEQQSFVEAAHLVRGEHRDYEVPLKIPEDAVPSYKGRTIKVTWKLLAEVDLPRAVDKKSEMLIEVLQPMLRGNVALETPRRGSVCAVEFELASPWIAAGSVLQGAVVVQPKQDLLITGATLELVRVEFVYTGTVTRTNRVKEKVLEIGHSRNALRKSSERLGFRIDIPPNAQPFLAVPQARGYYELRAKVSIKQHIDCAASIPLLIYNAPISVQTGR